MTSLSEFLLARIAEDEAAATDMRKHRSINGLPCPRCGQTITMYGSPLRETSAVTAHHRPLGPDLTGCELSPEQWRELSDDGPTDEGRRVLAECDAKRRIVERYAIYADPPHDDFALGNRNAIVYDMQSLAAIYSDHPDYLPEWKP